MKSSPPNPLLEAALSYAARGWHVLALHTPTKGLCSCGRSVCQSIGKHPRWHAELLPSGVNSATVDPTVIRSWWRQWPDANVGIATGAISGFDVLDCDPRHGGDESLAELVAEQWGRLPETVEAITGSLGTHYLWKHTRDFPNKANLAPGLDVRGNGGYICVAPSLHSSGRNYCWDAAHHPDDMEIAIFPGVFSVNGAQPDAFKAPLNVEEALSGVPEGRRELTIVSLAGKLRRADVPLFYATDLILRSAASCQPPFDATEALERVQRVYNNYAPEKIIPIRKREPDAPQIYRASDLLTMRFADLQWTVPGIIPDGCTLVVGRPKIGKSFFVLEVLIGIAITGRTLGNRAVDQGDVLYLALEDTPRRLQGRLVTMLEGCDLDASRISTATRWPKMDHGGLDLIRVWLDDHPTARCIVIDTFAKFRPTVETKGNAYEQDYQAMNTIKELSDERGISIYVVHHTRKMLSEDIFEMVSGTTGLTGAVDTTVVLVKKRGESDGTLHITGRDVEDQQLAVQFDKRSCHWSLTGQAAEIQETKTRDLIVGILERSNDPMKPNEVAELVGKSRDVVKQALWRMAADGEIRKLGNGYYRK